MFLTGGDTVSTVTCIMIITTFLHLMYTYRGRMVPYLDVVHKESNPDKISIGYR